MRRASKVDSCQPAVVAHLRSVGWAVRPTHTQGQDFPDLVVSRRMRGIPWCALVELKTPGEKLTLGQKRFAEEWLGPIIVATSPEDAEDRLNAEFQHHWFSWGRGLD
jgi:hypothetical protein